MPIAGQLRIPLSDGINAAGIEHIEAFESISEHIRNIRTLYDDFADNSINTSLWTEVDSGSNINEVNQRIEGNGNESYNANGLISKTAFTKTAGQSMMFSITPPVANKDIGIVGLIDSTALSWTNMGIGLWLLANGKFHGYLDGNQYNTGYSYIGGKTYNIRITYQPKNSLGWAIFVQSPDDANYSQETPVYVSFTNWGAGSTLYFQMNLKQTTTGNTYLDNVTTQLFPASVSPTTAGWVATQATKIKWSTARVTIYKDGAIQAATSTDWKIQKAVNNGSYNGTWLTLSGLRALADDTISDATSSVKVVSQYNSDTTYEVKTPMYLVVDVEYPAGGGGSNLIDGGLIR